LKCFMNPGPVIYYKNYILGIFTNHMNFFLNCIQIHVYRIDKTLLKKVLFPLFKIKKKKHKGKRIKTEVRKEKKSHRQASFPWQRCGIYRGVCYVTQSLWSMTSLIDPRKTSPSKCSGTYQVNRLAMYNQAAWYHFLK
jgi:hypothetical protein